MNEGQLAKDRSFMSTSRLTRPLSSSISIDSMLILHPLLVPLLLLRSTVEIAKVQPLAGEVLGERAGSVVREHAACFALEHGRIVQFILNSQVQQLVVRNTRP